jgi:hypothetical protein
MDTLSSTCTPANYVRTKKPYLIGLSGKALGGYLLHMGFESRR